MEVGQGGSWSLPGEVPQGMLWWGCGSTAKASWLLKKQVPGMREIAFCSRNVLRRGLHLQQKLLNCSVGPWAGEEQHQPVLSDAVGNPSIAGAVLAAPKVSSGEDREVGSCWSPKATRRGACSSPSSPFHVGAAIGKPT